MSLAVRCSPYISNEISENNFKRRSNILHGHLDFRGAWRNGSVGSLDARTYRLSSLPHFLQFRNNWKGSLDRSGIWNSISFVPRAGIDLKNRGNSRTKAVSDVLLMISRGQWRPRNLASHVACTEAKEIRLRGFLITLWRLNAFFPSSPSPCFILFSF